MAISDISSRRGPVLAILPGTRLAARLGRARRILTVWRRRRDYRNELKRLKRVGPHMIADIGLSLDAARSEIQKPVWRP